MRVLHCSHVVQQDALVAIQGAVNIAAVVVIDASTTLSDAVQIDRGSKQCHKQAGTSSSLLAQRAAYRCNGTSTARQQWDRVPCALLAVGKRASLDLWGWSAAPVCTVACSAGRAAGAEPHVGGRCERRGAFFDAFSSQRKHRVRKMGFLKKRGSKRWFLLLDNWLYWFPKVQEPSPECGGSPFADARPPSTGATCWGRHATVGLPREGQWLRVSVAVRGRACSSLITYPSTRSCNVLKGDKPREFVIVNPSDKNYVLTANTDEDQQEWIEAISRLTEVEAKALNYTAGQVIEKRGLLTIKVFVVRL